MPTRTQIAAALASWQADVADGKVTPYANRDEARSGLARVVLHVPMNSYVNCWTFRTAESHAMWRVYCPTSESVAIRTTLGRLYDSLPEHVEFTKVRYEGDPKLFSPLQLSLMSQKRNAFEYEQEIRALVPAPPLDGDPKPNPLPGLAIEWDPTHVESIAIHPEADAATIQTVRAVVASLAPTLSDRVALSEMAPGPATAWDEG